MARRWLLQNRNADGHRLLREEQRRLRLQELPRPRRQLVILESSNAEFTYQYWFFPDRVAVKVLRAESEYHFLLETVVGGSAGAEDYFVMADGIKRLPQSEFARLSPDWIILGDPKARHLMFLGKTPDDDLPDRIRRQTRSSGLHNMDIFSFGRAGAGRDGQIHGLTGTEHVCVIGFASANREHDELARMMERFRSDPFALADRSPPPAPWGPPYLQRPAE